MAEGTNMAEFSRPVLREKGFSDEQIDYIMQINGDAANRRNEEIKSITDELTGLRKYKEDREAADAAAETNRKMEERFAKTLGDRKFTTDYNRKGVFEKFCEEANKEGAKPDEDIIKDITDGQSGLFVTADAEKPKPQITIPGAQAVTPPASESKTYLDGIYGKNPFYGKQI